MRVEVPPLRVHYPVVARMLRVLEGVPGRWVVFGSLADGTATDYWDWDLLWLAPPEADPRLLRPVHSYMVLTRPTQHHGVFVWREGEPAPLPPSALVGAGAVGGGLSLDFGEVVAPSLRMREKFARAPTPKNLYEVKLLLSQVALYPALYYRHRGQDLPKPKAIAKMMEEFPETAKALRVATEIRRLWKEPMPRWRRGAASWPEPLRAAWALWKLSPGVPAWIRFRMDSEFWDSVRAMGKL